MNVTLRGSAKVIYTAELQVYNYCSALGQLMTECEKKNTLILCEIDLEGQKI